MWIHTSALFSLLILAVVLLLASSFEAIGLTGGNSDFLSTTFTQGVATVDFTFNCLEPIVQSCDDGTRTFTCGNVQGSIQSVQAISTEEWTSEKLSFPVLSRIDVHANGPGGCGFWWSDLYVFVSFLSLLFLSLSMRCDGGGGGGGRIVDFNGCYDDYFDFSICFFVILWFCDGMDSNGINGGSGFYTKDDWGCWCSCWCCNGWWWWGWDLQVVLRIDDHFVLLFSSIFNVWILGKVWKVSSCFLASTR